MAFWDDIRDMVMGKPDKMKRVPTMAPYQEEAFKGLYDNPIEDTELYGAGADYYKRILASDPDLMNQFYAPEMRKFQEQIAPGLAARFAGQGTGSGALNSSSFQQALSREGSNLAERLAAMKANLQQSAAQSSLQHAQQPYANKIAQSQISPYAYMNEPGSEGILQPALQAAGSYIGGGQLDLSSLLKTLRGSQKSGFANAQIGKY